jgi:hypothetical protein
MRQSDNPMPVLVCHVSPNLSKLCLTACSNFAADNFFPEIFMGISSLNISQFYQDFQEKFTIAYIFHDTISMSYALAGTPVQIYAT